MKERDRYLKLVEWSEADHCYIGSVPGWLGACCHGEEEEKVYHELCQIVDEWIETFQAEGRPLPPTTTGKSYSGKFQLRTGSDLHQALAIKALQEGASLNHFCIQVLQRAIHQPATPVQNITRTSVQPIQSKIKKSASRR